MSKPMKETITCPKCGAQREFVIWESLNAEISPDAKKMLTEGTLFRFACECGYCADVDYPTLYHDMTHQVMVYYVHEENAKKVEGIFGKTILPTEFEMGGYRFRIVHSRNELREKSIIFDNNLDDRVISILKVLCCAEVFKQYPDAHIDEILFFDNEGKWGFQFIGSVTGVVDISESFYNDIRETYSDRLENEEESFYIDFEWAKDFLKGE